jgi:hypothetical protein
MYQEVEESKPDLWHEPILYYPNVGRSALDHCRYDGFVSFLLEVKRVVVLLLIFRQLQVGEGGLNVAWFWPPRGSDTIWV